MLLLLLIFVITTQMFSGVSGCTRRPRGAPGSMITLVGEWLQERGGVPQGWAQGRREVGVPGREYGRLWVRVERGASGTKDAEVCERGLEGSFLKAHPLHIPCPVWGKRTYFQAQDGGAKMTGTHHGGMGWGALRLGSLSSVAEWESASTSSSALQTLVLGGPSPTLPGGWASDQEELSNFISERQPDIEAVTSGRRWGLSGEGGLVRLRIPHIGATGTKVAGLCSGARSRARPALESSALAGHPSRGPASGLPSHPALTLCSLSHLRLQGLSAQCRLIH